MIIKPYENENYNSYINRILKSRENIKVEDLTHRHHIVPKCIGGTNEPSNLIYLYHQEHYEAHRLLALENPDSYGLQYAWFLMAQPKPSIDYEVTVTADDYAMAMKRCSELSKKLLIEHPIYKTGKDNTSSRSVRCIETNRVFETCRDAAIYANLKGKRGGCKISENCNKKRQSAGKHPETGIPLHWEWVDECRLNKSIYRTNYVSRKVKCIETQEIFDNAKQAGIWAGLGGKTPEKNISQCCNGKRETAGKHPIYQYRLHWEYADDNYNNQIPKYQPKDPKIKSIKIAESNKRRRKKVLCVETGDIFDCVEDAGLWCGYKGSYIGDCCRGKRSWSGYHPITEEKLHWEYQI